MNYSSQLTFVPTLIYFIQAAGFVNYICILRISIYPSLVCFTNRFVWALNLNHNCLYACVLCACAYICMKVQVWVCYLNHQLAMLGCRFDTLHPNLMKSSMNSLQMHDGPLLLQMDCPLLPWYAVSQDCPSVRCWKGTTLVWNVFVPSSLSLDSAWLSAQKHPAGTLTRDLVYSVWRARWPQYSQYLVFLLHYSCISSRFLTGRFDRFWKTVS